MLADFKPDWFKWERPVFRVFMDEKSLKNKLKQKLANRSADGENRSR